MHYTNGEIIPFVLIAPIYNSQDLEMVVYRSEKKIKRKRTLIFNLLYHQCM